LQIGSKPGQMVFRGRESQDTFLVFDAEEETLHLYVTVETLLRPGLEVFAERQDEPYFWSDATGMMSILSKVDSRGFGHIEGPEDAIGILQLMEESLTTL
jgi:hypothetical protein